MGNPHLVPHLNRMLELLRDRGASYEIDSSTGQVHLTRTSIEGLVERRFIGVGVIAAVQTLEREREMIEANALACAERDWKAIDAGRARQGAQG